MVRYMDWISVKECLPEEGVPVLIYLGGSVEVARIEKGISMEEREKMKSGELPDKEEFGYVPGIPPFILKRSSAFKGADEFGNNAVPYRWYAQSGPMQWFGQRVSHWMPIPDPPETD